MNATALIRAAACATLCTLAEAAAIEPGRADTFPCIECIRLWIGPPSVVRGPFADELDAPFTALKLSDGSFRGFTANATTYAVDGSAIDDLQGTRRPVLQAGEPDSRSDCGRWLTSAQRVDGAVIGLVHQERACNYGLGQTDKSMAIAISRDDGLTWTQPETIIAGKDQPRPGRITGEGDCTMVDGLDGYLYAYCLRNSDWQTIVARAPRADPSAWHKYLEGSWNEPGIGGEATAIGFLGPGAGYLLEHGTVATVTADPWFEGVRLSLSADRVSFVDLDEPLIPIDGSEWNRPAETALVAYASILNPANGSNAVEDNFLLTYIYVPPGEGFEHRYLVQQDVSLLVEAGPLPVQAGLALTRWRAPDRTGFVTSTGPLTGDRLGYQQERVVAHVLTRRPDGADSIKIEECSIDRPGRVVQLLAEDGSCVALGYRRERTAGWLYAKEQPNSVPVYRCVEAATQTHFASNDPACEGLGAVEFLLGYGLQR